MWPAAAHGSLAPAQPDFSWGKSLPSPVRHSLEVASAKWRDANSVPTSPKWLKSPKLTVFDEYYFRELLQQADQGPMAYSLLDAAFRKQKSLDECRSLYAKTVKQAGRSAPASAIRFDDSYYYLRSQIKLATGLSRAAISREMTSSETSNYCFQAMESAIDALRDAADDAGRVPGGAKRSDCIRKLRSELFDRWERAQLSKNTALIGGINLQSIFDNSGLASSVLPQSRL
jgi:hypothetical protein